MTRIVFLLVAVATVAGVVASIASVAGHANDDVSPVFVTKIPAGYRDWRLISVAHEEGNLHSFAAVLGNDVAIKAYRGGTLPVPGRRNHRRFALQSRPVGGKQQSLWRSPILRSRRPTQTFSSWSRTRRSTLRPAAGGSVTSMQTELLVPMHSSRLAFPATRKLLATLSSPVTRLDIESVRGSDDTMTTQLKNQNHSKGPHDETTRGQIAPSAF